ncbi:protease IV (PspA) [hydrothermal vent metagenome]|uniref:Protease IV (PspA) n=1 Tax=hydrothermal vent metagenome TaxID=652676 RepID=A0A3B1E937_9ZZZZ
MKLHKKIFLPITAPIKFIQNNFKAVVFVTILISIISSTNPQNIEKPNLQRINLYGAIMSAEDILEQIQTVKNNKNIKGVLLNVNSPGGAVAPSIEIAFAIKELRQVKPVIAYASGMMTSGSYYASIWANEIIANPGAIIGSIGVIMQSLDASELISKIGIKSQIVKIGRYKEAGTPTRKWEKYERDELEKVIRDTYKLFVSDVSQARQLNPKNHTKFADAHIFTASQAKEVGLIDKVKHLSYAKENKIDKFMKHMTEGIVSNISTHLNELVAY